MAASTARDATASDDDPYAILGVPKTASAAEIKKAHRRLVRMSHPDINPDDPGAEARFVKISAAYEILGDPATRARFDAGEIDAAGHEKPQKSYYRDYGQRVGPRQTAQDFSGMHPDDLFADLFRRHDAGGQGGFAARGQDHSYRLAVPFLDAARGGASRIMLPDGGPLDITIPAGLTEGQILRLRGKGGEGMGGAPSGDALVTIMIEPHPVFRRDGDDILVTIPISIDEAVLGARIEVPTIAGDVSVSIPKGSNSGRVLRLRGRGVKHGDMAGDQLAELRIMLPVSEDEALSAFLEEWRKDRTDNPRKDLMRGAPR